MKTLISKANSTQSYFNDYIEKIEYVKSTGEYTSYSSKFTPENIEVFEDTIKTMNQDIYKDSRILAEELPKLQAMNNRLVKGGVPIEFEEEKYNLSARFIYIFSHAN